MLKFEISLWVKWTHSRYKYFIHGWNLLGFTWCGLVARIGRKASEIRKGFWCLCLQFAVKVIWNLYCVTGCAGLRIIPLQGICPCLDALWGIHLKSEAGCPPPSRVCSEALHSFGRTWWSSWGCSQQEAGTHSPRADPRSEKLR